MPTRVPKLWGHELIFTTEDDDFCHKLLVYDGVRTSSKHYHERKKEVFTVVRGLFDIEWSMLDDPNTKGAQRFGPGACLVLEPRTVHRVMCLSPGGGVICEASSGDDQQDCIRLEPSINPF